MGHATIQTPDGRTLSIDFDGAPPDDATISGIISDYEKSRQGASPAPKAPSVPLTQTPAFQKVLGIDTVAANAATGVDQAMLGYARQHPQEFQPPAPARPAGPPPTQFQGPYGLGPADPLGDPADAPVPHKPGVWDTIKQDAANTLKSVLGSGLDMATNAFSSQGSQSNEQAQDAIGQAGQRALATVNPLGVLKQPAIRGAVKAAQGVSRITNPVAASLFPGLYGGTSQGPIPQIQQGIRGIGSDFRDFPVQSALAVAPFVLDGLHAGAGAALDRLPAPTDGIDFNPVDEGLDSAGNSLTAAAPKPSPKAAPQVPQFHELLKQTGTDPVAAAASTIARIKAEQGVADLDAATWTPHVKALFGLDDAGAKKALATPPDPNVQPVQAADAPAPRGPVPGKIPAPQTEVTPQETPDAQPESQQPQAPGQTVQGIPGTPVDTVSPAAPDAGQPAGLSATAPEPTPVPAAPQPEAAPGLGMGVPQAPEMVGPPVAAEPVAPQVEAATPSEAPAMTPKADKTPPPEYSGSVNLDRMDISDEAKQAIRDATQKLGLGSADGRPVLSHEAASAAADALGLTPEMAKAIPAGESPSGVHPGIYSIALRRLLARHAEELRGDLADAQREAVQSAHDDLLQRSGALSRTSGQALSLHNLIASPMEEAIARAQDNAQALESVPELPRAAPKADVEPQTTTARPNSPRPARAYGSTNRIFTEDVKNAAVARIRAAGGRLHSGIDPELLKDFATLGAYHIEAKARNFGDWAQRMVADLPSFAQEPQENQQHVYAAAKAEHDGAVTRRVRSVAQKVLADALAPTMGRQGVADYFDALADGPHPDLLHKIVAGDYGSLTEAEKDFADRAARDNTPKRTKGPSQASLTAVRAIAKEFSARARAQAAQRARASRPAPTAEEMFSHSMRQRLGRAGGDGFVRDLKAQGLLDRLLGGGGSLSEAERASVLASHDANRPPARTPAPRTPGVEAVSGILAEGRKAQRAAVKAQKAAMDPLERSLLGRVGKVNGPEFVNRLMADPQTSQAVAKLRAGVELTDAEKRAVAHNLDDLKSGRKPSAPSDISKTLTGIVRDAKAGRLGFDSAKAVVQHELTESVPPEKVGPMNAELAQVGDGDYRALADIHAKYSDAPLGEKFIFALRSGLLSGPNTLKSIVASHLLGATAEDTVRRAASAAVDPLMGFLLNDKGGRSVQGFSPSATAKSVAAGVKALPEGIEYVRRGPTAMQLKRGGMALAGDGEAHGLETEAINGAKHGPLGALVAYFPRTHGAVFHVIGKALYERGRVEAATLKAQRLGGEPMKYRSDRDVLAQADEYRREQLYLNRNQAASGIGALARNSGPVGRVLIQTQVPFNKVPMNLAMRAVEYSGAGVPISGARALGYRVTGRDFATGKEIGPSELTPGERQAELTAFRRNLSTQAGRGIVGPALGVAGGYLAAKSGLLTPPNAKEHKYGSVNTPPVSAGPVHIPAYSFETDRLQPVITAPNIGGEIFGALHHRPADFITPFSDNPYFSALDNGRNVLEAADGRPGAMDRWAGRQLSEYIPTLLSQVASTTDPSGQTRKQTALTDFLKNRVPGLREGLPASGRPQQSNIKAVGAFPALASPVGIEPRDKDTYGRGAEYEEKVQAVIDRFTSDAKAHGYSDAQIKKTVASLRGSFARSKPK